jgi:hypothetical protein
MKDYLLPLKNKPFDGINFYRNEEGDFEVSAFMYKIAGEKVEGSAMGDLYDIIIFNEEQPKMPERFKAILTSPLHYISRMIDDGFLGVVARVTTTSDDFMENIEQHMNKRVEKYIKDYEEILNDEQT